MTPAVTTPTARRAPKGNAGPLRQRTAPVAPRRVSGPIRGRTALPSRASRPEPRPAFASRVLTFARALPDHSLLDRVVRGRAWIPLLGVMLVGIVAMQVEVLKLGASIGRSLQRGTELQSRNEALRISVASLADEQRIERMAAAMGMAMPASDAIGFLSARSPGNVGRALANIHSPNAQDFASMAFGRGAFTDLATAGSTSQSVLGQGQSVTGAATTAGSSGAGQAPPTTNGGSVAVNQATGSAITNQGTVSPTAPTAARTAPAPVVRPSPVSPTQSAAHSSGSSSGGTAVGG